MISTIAVKSPLNVLEGKCEAQGCLGLLFFKGFYQQRFFSKKNLNNYQQTTEIIDFWFFF